MKKILSFVLVLAMVLGSVSMVFATDYPDVKDTDSCAEAVNVLSAVGVIEGYNDGTFKPEKTISRAEAIKIVVAALGLPVTEGNSYPTQFTDVPATAWYSGYVRYGVALGITEGTSKDHFSPDSMVTYDQMITFIMRALGYSDKLVGGYPTGYIMRAFQEGIITADTTTGTAPAPRGDIAEILYAALNKNFVVYDPEKDVFNNEPDKYAVAKPTMYALLGNWEDPTEYVVGSDLAVDASNLVNLADYLGAKITVVRTSDAENKIVGINKVLSEFVTGSSKASTAAEVKFGDYAQASTVTTANFAGFKNGVKDTTVTIPTGAAKTSDVYAVVVKDGKVAEIVSRQTWDVAQGADGRYDGEELKLDDEDVLGTLLGCAFKTLEDDDKAIDANSFAIEGVKALSDIKKGDVVYVYTAGGKITKVEVGQDVVEGSLTAISSDKADYTIGGTKYQLAPNAVNDYDSTTVNMKGLLGASVKAHLDINGKIYEAEEVKAEDTTVYAVILNGAPVDNAGTARELPAFYKVLLLADNTEKDYDLKNAADYSATKFGELVALDINDKNQITKITSATSEAAGTAEISANGVLADGANILDSNAKVLLYDGTDVKVKKNYSSLDYSKLLKQKTSATFEYSYFAKSGKVTAMLVKGVASTVKNPTAVIDVKNSTEGAKDTASIVAYVDGAKTDYTSTNTMLTTTFASAGAALYDLTVADGKISAASKVAADDTIAKTALTSRSTSVSATVVKAAGKLVEVDEDIIVYTYTASSGAWTVATGSDRLVGLKDVAIDLYDTSSTKDGIYEVAIITK